MAGRKRYCYIIHRFCVISLFGWYNNRGRIAVFSINLTSVMTTTLYPKDWANKPPTRPIQDSYITVVAWFIHGVISKSLNNLESLALSYGYLQWQHVCHTSGRPIIIAGNRKLARRKCDFERKCTSFYGM